MMGVASSRLLLHLSRAAALELVGQSGDKGARLSERVMLAVAVVRDSSVIVRGVELTRAGGVAAGSLAGVDMAALATAVSCYPVKFAVAFPLTYHYAGALRHTLWDRKPETMLNNKDAEKSSYLVMGGSTLAAAGLAALSW